MMHSWLLGTTIATISSLIAFGLVLFYFDPETSGWIGLTLFLLTLSAATLGTLTVIGFNLRERRSANPSASLITSFRQAALLAALLLVLLLLGWWHLYRAWQLWLASGLFVAIEILIWLRVKYKRPTSLPDNGQS